MASIIKGSRDQVKGLDDQTKGGRGGIAGFFDAIKNNIGSTLGHRLERLMPNYLIVFI